MGVTGVGTVVFSPAQCCNQWGSHIFYRVCCILRAPQHVSKSTPFKVHSFIRSSSRIPIEKLLWDTLGEVCHCLA